MNEVGWFIKNFSPCAEARTYLQGFTTLQAAWDNCARADWMVWTLAVTDQIDYLRPQLIRTAYEFLLDTKLVVELNSTELKALAHLRLYIHGTKSSNDAKDAIRNQISSHHMRNRVAQFFRHLIKTSAYYQEGFAILLTINPEGLSDPIYHYDFDNYREQIALSNLIRKNIPEIHLR